LQVSSGGGAHASGPAVADMALGAHVLAEAAHRLAERYDVLIALHTDHCSPKILKPFVDPLIETSEAHAARDPSSTATCSTDRSSRSARISRSRSGTWSASPPST
jgi:fructose/tagatose bisphosphate aldolase